MQKNWQISSHPSIQNFSSLNLLKEKIPGFMERFYSKEGLKANCTQPFKNFKDLMIERLAPL